MTKKYRAKHSNGQSCGASAPRMCQHCEACCTSAVDDCQESACSAQSVMAIVPPYVALDGCPRMPLEVLTSVESAQVIAAVAWRSLAQVLGCSLPRLQALAAAVNSYGGTHWGLRAVVHCGLRLLLLIAIRRHRSPVPM